MGFDVDGIVATDGHITSTLNSLAALVGGREDDGDVTTTDVDVGITLDGGAIGRFVVGHNGAAICVDDDDATADVDVAISGDTLRGVTRMGDVDSAACDVDGTVALDAFVGNTRGGDVEVTVRHDEGAIDADAFRVDFRHVDGDIAVVDGAVGGRLNTVGTAAVDDDGAAVLDEGVGMETVGVSVDHGDVSRVDGQGAFRVNGVFVVASDVQRASTDAEVSFGIKSSVD